MKGVRVTFGVGGVLNSRSFLPQLMCVLQQSSKLQVPVLEIDTGDYGHEVQRPDLSNLATGRRNSYRLHSSLSEDDEVSS